MLKLTTLSLVVLAGSALAQPKAGAPAQPKPEAPPPAVAPPMPPKPPEAPPEIIEAAKRMNGAWKCTGKADIRGTTNDIKATITHKVEPTLNKFWVQSNFVGTAAKMPPMKFTMFTTYDTASKKMWRTSINGMGGHSTGFGTIADKKVVWEMDGVGPMGPMKMRQTEEFVSPKEVKVTGELSRDNGKTWVFDHDASCKK